MRPKATLVSCQKRLVFATLAVSNIGPSVELGRFLILSRSLVCEYPTSN